MIESNLKEGQYLEIKNQDGYDFISVRILKKDNLGIDTLILSDKSKRKFSNYFIEKNNYRYPYISKELIENCGFSINQKGFFERNDIAIIDCVLCRTEENQKLQTLDYASKSFGFKVLNKSKKEDFLSDFKNVPFETEKEEFQKKYNTIFTVEDLFTKLKEFNIEDLDFDDAILKSKK